MQFITKAYDLNSENINKEQKYQSNKFNRQPLNKISSHLLHDKTVQNSEIIKYVCIFFSCLFIERQKILTDS